MDDLLVGAYVGYLFDGWVASLLVGLWVCESDGDWFGGRWPGWFG